MTCFRFWVRRWQGKTLSRTALWHAWDSFQEKGSDFFVHLTGWRTFKLRVFCAPTSVWAPEAHTTNNTSTTMALVGSRVRVPLRGQDGQSFGPLAMGILVVLGGYCFHFSRWKFHGIFLAKITGINRKQSETNIHFKLGFQVKNWLTRCILRWFAYLLSQWKVNVQFGSLSKKLGETILVIPAMQ